MAEPKSPLPIGALSLAYRAARAQWASCPERLPDRFVTSAEVPLLDEAGPVDAPGLARALRRWTGFATWTTAFASLEGARLALLCAIGDFHHRYGTGRRIVLVPSTRAGALARAIATARYRCVAVAESSPGVPRSSALAQALDSYGRDVAAVWQCALGSPSTLERRVAEWRPLLDLGVKFVAEGPAWSWTFGRVPLETLGLHGAILPFPDTLANLGPRGVALGVAEPLASLLPVSPSPDALTDRIASARFLARTLPAIESFVPEIAATTVDGPREKRSALAGKTVDEPSTVFEDTDRRI